MVAADRESKMSRGEQYDCAFVSGQLVCGLQKHLLWNVLGSTCPTDQASSWVQFRSGLSQV